ncbi:MAG TPA: site-specific DNA-methyltransferase [Ktedonobacter sp.]|jgi:site-specific DNA-methyltransferase (cytosine-N4-specific)|nr:site-specific DNA-methyltransferase [Ktedonobacter sp.]
MMIEKPLYITDCGEAYLGDSLQLLDQLEADSIDLVITSPPFALQRQKVYGNVNQEDYVDWLVTFCKKVYRVLTPSGSFVLDLGGAYQTKRPVRSLHNYRILLKLCDEVGYRLAEEFFWHNPAKLPSPIEWVNKRKIRVKDSVDTVWWLSKDDYPKADITRVLVPYSERMQKLQTDPEKYYKPKLRPSGHDIGAGFAVDNGGAIPSNLLQIPNTESNSRYIQLCKMLDVETHPARFPMKLPLFFIQMLTDPGDTVLDIFAGSNTTGAAAESLERHWIAFEQNRMYLLASTFRFLDKEVSESEVTELYHKLLVSQEPTRIGSTKQPSLFNI